MLAAFEGFLIDKRRLHLVELLLVVALVGIVLAIPIQALFLITGTGSTTSHEPALMDGTSYLPACNEIRAADKPSGGARAWR